MEIKQLGNTDIPISAIALGGMPLCFKQQTTRGASYRSHPSRPRSGCNAD